MRLFIAIEPEESVMRDLTKIQNTLRPEITARWTPADQFHLTLKFLGDTPDPELPDIIAALKAIQIDSPISLRMTGIVCFPPHGPIRIIAAAMEDDQNRCAKLAGEIDRACHDVGFPLENRKWTPHITLARVKERVAPDARGKLLSLPVTNPEFEVDHFVLKESRLTSDGATYLTVATFA
jgi:2'-5' RNA ligase